MRYPKPSAVLTIENDGVHLSFANNKSCVRGWVYGLKRSIIGPQ